MFVARLLQESDLDEMLALHLKLFPVVYNMEVMEQYLEPRYLAMGLWHISNGCASLIGVSTARRSWKDFLSTDKTAYLCTFGIAEEFRQRHLGTDFLNLFCKILYNHFQVKQMDLDMQKINTAAFKFYKNFGFTAVALKPDHYDLPGDVSDRNDAVYMTISLEDVVTRELTKSITLSSNSTHLMSVVPPLTWLNSLFKTP